MSSGIWLFFFAFEPFWQSQNTERLIAIKIENEEFGNIAIEAIGRR